MYFERRNDNSRHKELEISFKNVQQFGISSSFVKSATSLFLQSENRVIIVVKYGKGGKSHGILSRNRIRDYNEQFVKKHTHFASL